MPYAYERNTNGCDETFDIIQPDGQVLVCVHFWAEVERAEADAKLIVNALNAYQNHRELLESLERLLNVVISQKGILQAQVKSGSPIAAAQAAVKKARAA